MELEFKHAGLSVSFECDGDDHYDHVDLLHKIAALVEELASHTGVSLVVISDFKEQDEDDEDAETTNWPE
ncbi:MAG: hypothetical protein EBW12_07720 [Actinobacteria bacterium]|jgi:hypothetical protein|nr:hypothetical protein [Actinomycetota bacterium]